MKHLLKYLLAAAALPLWGQAAAAGPFGQLRGLCEPGKSVLLTAPTVVEGIVVSDYRSPNRRNNNGRSRTSCRYQRRHYNSCGQKGYA